MKTLDDKILESLQFISVAAKALAASAQVITEIKAELDKRPTLKVVEDNEHKD